MSPSKFTDGDITKGGINGQRSSPLRITKESHLIQKPSPARQQQQPVIIYTHSPKVIHAQARDFMALVQKLTGLTRTPDDNKPTESRKEDPDPAEIKQEPNQMQMQMPSDSYLTSHPSFGPNPSEFLYSPGHGGLFQNPNSMSSSIMDFVTGYQDY